MAKSTRKTLNERRVSGNGSARPQTPSLGAAPMRPTTARKTGLSDELIRLAYLCQAGILTRAEFEAAKARTLSEYRISPGKD
ncbi:MAG TPA: SHOCT domain-containing protein [Acidimicrobiales bacterium]|nr:SHOCT domain-containing protein [Acidimicrobiales bacterium]